MKKWLASSAVRLGAVLVLGAHASAVVVHGVVAAEQDASVSGLAEVVELVGEVAQALPVIPADRRALVGAERLGHQHVVVDGHGHERVAAQQRGEDVRGEHGSARRDAPDVGEHLDAVSGRVDAPHRRTLEDLDALLLGGARESGGELAGVHEGVASGLEHRAEIGRRGDGCLHLGLVQTHDAVLAAGRGILRPLVEPLELVRLGRHGEGSDALPLGIDPPFGDVRAHRVEVLHAQPVERVDLVRPAAEAVVAAVGEARFAESAVAAGCRPADRPRLDEGDAGVGVAPAREESRPQSGVAAPDDHEVDIVVPREGAPCRLSGEVVEPEHAVPRFGETAFDDGCCRPLSFEDGRAHGYHFPVAQCSPSSRSIGPPGQSALSRTARAPGRPVRALGSRRLRTEHAVCVSGRTACSVRKRSRGSGVDALVGVGREGALTPGRSGTRT